MSKILYKQKYNTPLPFKGQAITTSILNFRKALIPIDHNDVLETEKIPGSYEIPGKKDF